MGSGPAASYAYGTAVFAEFLSERFGPQLIRNIWEGCEQSPSGEVPLFLDVLDAELHKHSGQSLVRAFTEFTRWNLLTAERASVGRGYQRAREYPGIKLEPELSKVEQSALVEVNGLSARYLRLRPTLSQATAIRVTVVDPASETPTAAAAVWRASGEVSELSEVGMGVVQNLSPGDSLLVVVTGAVRGARARMVEVNFAPAPTPPILPIEPEPTASGCRLHSQRTPPDFLGLLTPLGLALLGFFRRQHRRLRALRPGP
jgi:hypothetical protein